MTSIRDTDKWQRGHTGERLVADMLRHRGWFVIPSYNYTGEDDDDKKAPMLLGDGEQYILPDLDASRSGLRIWAEVKTKAEATFTRNTRMWEHGLSLRQWNNYLKVEEITGCSCYLVFVEEKKREILWESISKLDLIKRIYQGDKMDRGGMIFFPRDSFHPFDEF